MIPVAIILLSGMVLFNQNGVCSAQEMRGVSGSISSDTTWNEASGPYKLTGPVTVNVDVTLTIEPGTTVNLQNYPLIVNGVLIAQGTDQQNTVLYQGQINFTTSSNGWNEETGSGSVFEGSTIDAVAISTENPVKINDCSIPHGITVHGPVILSNSVLSTPEFGYTSGLSAPLMTDQQSQYCHEAIRITSTTATISGNTVHGDISCDAVGASPIITDNTVYGIIHVGSFDPNIIAGSPVISGNTVSFGDSLGIFVHGESPIISNNTLTGPAQTDYVNSGSGILLYILNGGIATVYNNNITGFTDGINVANNSALIIERNLITFCHQAISGVGTHATIKNNTLRSNINAISIFFNFPPIIEFNNFQDNKETNIVLQNMSWQEVLVSKDINAANNWWGTTDQSLIAQSIHDKADDPFLGQVNYLPFLTEPNTQALPDKALQLPTASPTPTPIPTTSIQQNEFNIGSNSTISALSFNSTNSEISFTVNGTTGTTGYVEATISKNFMPHSENIKVNLDGNSINCSITSNNDAWVLFFTYTHSSHKVNIVQEQTLTQFNNSYLIYIAAGVIAGLLGLLGVIVWLSKRQN